MLYTPVVNKAMKLCFEAHAGRKDKSGIPYVNHPLHLAEEMLGEDATCVALLHDVMEDRRVTPGELRAIGLSERAIEALLLLTHDKSVPYRDYIEKLKHNEIARRVKIADLRHNSDLSRLDAVSEVDLERLRKYMDARVILGDMVYTLETPIGPISVEVNGRPYPFSVEDETLEGFTYYEHYPEYVQYKGGNPISGIILGSPDKTLYLKVEALPLWVGDGVSLCFDYGSNVVNWGSDEHVRYRVYAKDGYTMGLGFYNDEEYFDRCEERMHCFECMFEDNSYEIVDNPVRYRYFAFGHTIGVRIAWREGTTEDDALIVGWVAGF